MPFLPSELWLQIISHTITTQNRDLWRSLRRTNRQLRDCVEQHFKDHIITTTKLELTFGLPCYDARNPLRGRAIFHFSHFESSDNKASENVDGYGAGQSERIVCALVDVEPEHYMEQFLVRWNRLRESSQGHLPKSLEWTMYFTGEGEGLARMVRLKSPVAFSGREKEIEGAKVGLEWRGTVTSLYS